MQDSPWATLHALAQRARAARSAAELGFLLVNDSMALAPYRQGALWLSDSGILSLSGVVQPEANAPYVLWLEQVCRHWAAQEGDARSLGPADLPATLAQEWAAWWPAHALWLPSPPHAAGALLLLRDQPWSEAEQHWLGEWAAIGWHALQAQQRPRLGSWSALLRAARASLAGRPGQHWWQQRAWQLGALLLAVLLWPVHLSVLAPGELVPAHPVVVRAPLDGVIDVFHVQPNQQVRKGQPLFGFDEAQLQSRLEVAAQSLATAQTAYRQVAQQAVSDARYKTQLAQMAGKIAEKSAEVDYLGEQRTRARVLAPADGMAVLDDPSEWIGKPVSVGERVMRITQQDDVEVEAWLPLADAIALDSGAEVRLYLNASPLDPVAAQLRYMAFEAVQRPDGNYAYRVRAQLQEPTGHRIGQKGTAKLQGARVPLLYWVLRRPLATLRSALGY